MVWLDQIWQHKWFTWTIYPVINGPPGPFMPGPFMLWQAQWSRNHPDSGDRMRPLAAVRSTPTDLPRCLKVLGQITSQKIDNSQIIPPHSISFQQMPICWMYGQEPEWTFNINFANNKLPGPSTCIFWIASLIAIYFSEHNFLAYNNWQSHPLGESDQQWAATCSAGDSLGWL